MKKIILFVSTLLIGFNFSSCSDFLDVAPRDRFSDAAIWGDMTMAETFLNGIHGRIMPGTKKGTRTSVLTDEVFMIHDYWQNRYLLGATSPDNNTAGWNLDSDTWNYYYRSIKLANVFLKNIHSVPIKAGQEEWKEQMIGQAYFFRAWFYNELWTIMGKVVLISEPHDLASKYGEKRTTLDSVSLFILADCDSAIKRLPVVYSNPGKDFGRATKGAAMMLKSRVLLFKASKLFAENPDPGSPNANQRWLDAAAASKAVMDLRNENNDLVYSLKPIALGNHANQAGIMQTADNYAKLFSFDAETSPETIFMWRFTKDGNTGRNIAYLHQGAAGSGNGFNGWCTFAPTENLVSKFQNINGSVWNGILDPAVNPWEMRDPRLKATVLCDGDLWGYGDDRREVEFFVGTSTTGATLIPGRDSKANTSNNNGSRTSYSMRKFLDKDFNNGSGQPPYSAPWVFYRLAEVYLNYAECQIALGNDPEAIRYINMIRARVGMPDVAPGVSAADAYAYERQIELVFEEQRWNDIRRWKTIEDEYNNHPIVGVEIRKSMETGDKTYFVTGTIQQRKFVSPKMYFMPIARGETTRQKQLLDVTPPDPYYE